MCDKPNHDSLLLLCKLFYFVSHWSVISIGVDGVFDYFCFCVALPHIVRGVGELYTAMNPAVYALFIQLKNIIDLGQVNWQNSECEGVWKWHFSVSCALRTDSGNCGPETSQWVGEEIGSLTARPEEQEAPGTPCAKLRSFKMTQMPWAGAFSIIVRLSNGEEKITL